MTFKQALVAVTLAFLPTLGVADLCALGNQQINGNYFCQAVKSIQYSNVGTAGHYNQVIFMGADGTCKSQPKYFSGPNSPLDGEVSVHIRGPTKLNEFAVYAPSPGSKSAKKRVASPHTPAKAHRHRHAHDGVPAHSHLYGEVEHRQVVSATIDGQVVTWGSDYWGSSTVSPEKVMVTATIDGQTLSWLNNWFGLSSTPEVPPAIPSASAAHPVPANNPAPVNNLVVPQAVTNAPASTSAVPLASVNTPVPQPASPQPSGTIQVSSAPAQGGASSPALSLDLPAPPRGPGFQLPGTFNRISHYHAESQSVDNVTFLGNYGGQGSGVFDYNFGASLSYTNSDATGGAASSQVLVNKAILSDTEVIIMRGDKCDGDCGYVRPGSVAYHGFDGADKVFMFDFSMPMDGQGGFNGDMPAIWLLNAEIPRTVQYGKPQCNCWSSGCGEFDIAEALFDGSTFLKSTLHTNTPAGDSDYLARPTSGSMKLAVVFSSSTSTIRVQVLDDNTEFPATLDADDINNMCNQQTGLVSHFSIAK